MTFKGKHHYLAAIVFSLLVPLAWAQPAASEKDAPIAYLAGGIGKDELAAMQEQAKAFNVRLEFVELEEGSQHGNWTADATVLVQSQGRELARIEVPGPLLLLRLPAGRYTIEAMRNGERLKMEVGVNDPARPVARRFVWRAPKGSLGSTYRDQ